MRQVGAHIGSVVDITFTTRSGAPHTEPYRVVSQISFPQIGGYVSLGTGILTTTAGLIHVACEPGPQLALCRQQFAGHNLGTGGVRASFVPGPRGKAALDRYVAEYPSITSQPLARPPWSISARRSTSRSSSG